MQDSTRINIAKKLLGKARAERSRRASTQKDINRLILWVENAIEKNPEKKTAEERLQECFEYRTRIGKLIKIAKKQAERAKGYYKAFEDCVEGVRDFNANQLDFDDIKVEDPPAAPEKKDADKPGKPEKVSG